MQGFIKAATMLAGIAIVAAGCTVVVEEGPVRPAPGPRPTICPQIYAPVCAVRDGYRRTFSNACTARGQGFNVLYQGECRRAPEPAPAACPRIYNPVCAVRNGRVRAFANSCLAVAANHSVVGNAVCRQAGVPVR